ncbi:MAG: flagellar motor switch protein FliN [Gemmatimonadales bacterium]|nr:MAG: flagellar motor switch protein FliN [Gemmatimonadales bacterium]
MTNEEIEAIMAGAGEASPQEEASGPATGPGAALEGESGTASSPAAAFDGGGMSILHDLPLPVSVELGRTRLPVQEILALGRGSVVQLDRLAGEPVDLFVGDRKFAQGEVVVLGEQFGIRITRIVPSNGPLAGARG